MSSSQTALHPTWGDFAEALQLVDIYVSIEKNKCDADILSQISSSAKDHYAYDDPVSYIRFVMYPRLMRQANWLSDDVRVGRGTILEYYGRRGDIDEFFSQMIEMGAARNTYMEIAAFVKGCSND